MTRKFNFEKSILQMNAMYNLPIAPVPTFQKEIEWQERTFPNYKDATPLGVVFKRVQDFFGSRYQPKSILRDEVAEADKILDTLANANDLSEIEVDMLVELADLLGDIQVYCASEMARIGIPNQEVLKIIMESNESKLGADGKPIYNEQGKFMKGPNYWKPEPKIKELILELRGK